MTETNGEENNVTPITPPLPNDVEPQPKKTKKVFRKVKVLSSGDDQFYYVAMAQNGETVYTSETFTRRTSAVNAARREHEGRNEKYDYVLEYESAAGHLVRETL